MANVEQAQQMIPLITCEISFGYNVSELFFWCRCVLIWIFWGPDEFDQTPYQEQLCESWKTCLIVGLLPLMIILITASLSFEHI